MSVVKPVGDPDELANARKFAEAVSVVDGKVGNHGVEGAPIVRQLTGRTGRAGMGIRLGEELQSAELGSVEGGSDAPSSLRRRELAASFGQARRVVEMCCRAGFLGGVCNQVMARWRLVQGTLRLSASDWAVAKTVLGADCYPWATWLYEEKSERFYREYWNGPVEVTCARHERRKLVALQTIRDRLNADRSAAKITIRL